MARSTFEGPILAGDTRFGTFRNVGYAYLVQSAQLNLATVTPNTAGYSGGSSVFVDSNTIPNAIGPVYSPSATLFPSVLQSIPADTATNVYRGFVAYLPAGSRIVEIFVDCIAVAAVAGGSASLSSATVLVSNNWTVAGGTPTYATTGAISAVGRQALSTFTATQLTNQQATSTDVLPGSGSPSISQVVFTLSLVGTGLDTRTSLTGNFVFTVVYTQADGSIGTATVYPYGNFD